MSVLEILKLVWPLILIQFGFQIYALIHLIRTKKTKNLSPIIWGLIIVLGEIVGAALYFLIGKSED